MSDDDQMTPVMRFNPNIYKDGVHVATIWPVPEWQTPYTPSYKQGSDWEREQTYIAAYEDWYRRNRGKEPPKMTLEQWRMPIKCENPGCGGNAHGLIHCNDTNPDKSYVKYICTLCAIEVRFMAFYTKNRQTPEPTTCELTGCDRPAMAIARYNHPKPEMRWEARLCKDCIPLHKDCGRGGITLSPLNSYDNPEKVKVV